MLEVELDEVGASCGNGGMQAIGTLGTRAIGSQKSMVTSETADETVAERLGR